ncbi:MAG: NAD(P)H-hydrate dehydratase [candidate division WOR-3 bacterium]
MFRLVTAVEMTAIDRRAVSEHGITNLTLMENAGRAVAESLEKEVGSLVARTVLVVCGTGNNGGDGLVAARHLAKLGAVVSCVLLGKVSQLKPEPKTNAELLAEAGVSLREVTSPDELPSLFQNQEVVIDAIFGTGLSRPPEGIYAEAIRLINRSKALVVAIDIPSGVDSDTGKVYEPAVRAQLTITMGLPKIGLYFYPGRGHVGRLRIAEIGYPKQLLEDGADTFLVDDDYVREHLPHRPADGHKGTFGTCLLVCGSASYSGAACLAGMATVRSGCGLVVIGFPKSLSDIIGSRVIEAVKLPLPETQSGSISYSALEPILEHAAEADCLAIGPGITTHPSSKRLVRELLRRVQNPVVVDADGINSLAEDLKSLAQAKAQLVLTPHPGELGRLINRPAAEVNADRIKTARSFAQEHRLVLLLKGAPTVIGAPDGRLFLNPTGNSGLASGGTGDVLTGLLAGLVAQGAPPLDAAIIAAFLHGRAADIAAGELTEFCLAATDLLHYLPRAFHSLLAAP